jgi:hypothetical protein
LFEIPAELSKAPPPPRASSPSAVQEAELQRAARAVAVAPASVQHGRPTGAGNALAFHAWRKDPNAPKSNPDR